MEKIKGKRICVDIMPAVLTIAKVWVNLTSLAY
jgi:hypothetical protein